MNSLDRKISNIPSLRFVDFKDEWQQKDIGDIFSQRQERYTEGLELLSVTMSEGVKRRSDLKGRDNSSNNKSNYKRVYKNDIVYNSMRMWQGASGVSKFDGVVSPAYTVLKGSSDCNSVFFGYYFKLPKTVHIFERYSQGLTSDTWNLKYPQIAKIKIDFPSKEEQDKIAKFFEQLDSKIAILEVKIDKCNKFKIGIMQRIFSQQVRLKDDKGSNYDDWKFIALGEVLRQRCDKNGDALNSEVFSVAKNAGVINQIEHLGRSYAGHDTSNYRVVKPWDIVYTKSPTSDFPYGIVKQNKLVRSGIVSVLYGVYEPQNRHIGSLLDDYFSSWIKTYNYLNPIVQKGAKNTINIGDGAFLKGSKLLLPLNTDEQRKIAEFVNILTEKINIQEDKLCLAKQFKKAALKQMLI